MAITALQLFAEARNVYGYTGTLADVQAAMAAVDRAALEQAERARYHYVIWDEVSPIGGHPANYWREIWARNGEWPEGGKVFLLYIDGHLRLVQPHDPLSSGHVPMDEETARARAQAYIDALVEQAVDQQVKEQVLVTLLS